MEFKWDPEKNAANITKHGIDFARAIEIFDGFTLEWQDTRREYGEERIVAVGQALGRILTVIHTRRGAVIRIISARRARKNEEEAYRAIRPPEAPGPD